MRNLVDLAVAMSESRVQIMRTGKWKHPQYGDLEISESDLHQFKENFDKGVRGVKLFVDLDHDPHHAAYGEFKNLQVEGGKLFADIEWTKQGENLVKSGQYQYFSPEFKSQYTDPETGKTFSNVLLGGAITNRPFLKNMDPIQLSEFEQNGVVMFYDPDHDGDDDSTTNPKQNPDWKLDVLAGITKWPDDEKQQAELTKIGAKKEACDAAYAAYHKSTKMSEALKPFEQTLIALSEGFIFDSEALSEPIWLAEDKVTNAHKSPPIGKPEDKSQYADPEHYKYPIDGDHIKAAVGYFNHPDEKSKGGYSDEQWAAIGRRIAAAANKLIGPGHHFKDGKIETGKTKMAEGDDPTDGIGESTPGKIDDVDGEKYNEPQHKTDPKGATQMSDDKTVSLSEFESVKNRLDEVVKENRRMKLSEVVDGLIYDKDTNAGHLAPSQRDDVIALMEGMTDEQAQKFAEVLKKSPAVIEFGEKGFSGSQENRPDKTVMLAERAAKYMQQGMTMSEAHAKAEYDLEHPEVK